MVRTIRVNVVVCWHERFTTMFRNVVLNMANFDEDSTRNMNQAFTEQHPVLLSRIPIHTDERGFTTRANFECERIYN